MATQQQPQRRQNPPSRMLLLEITLHLFSVLAISLQLLPLLVLLLQQTIQRLIMDHPPPPEGAILLQSRSHQQRTEKMILNQ